MRNLKNKRKQSHKSQKQFVRLKDIKKVIDSKIFNKEKAFSLLQRVDEKRLKPYHLVEYYYLYVRFHFQSYKQEDAIEHLELAIGLINYMDKIAFDKKVYIQESSYHFTRAYISFLVSKLSFDEYTTPIQLSKARRITKRALEFEPNSSSFIWLNKLLSA